MRDVTGKPFQKVMQDLVLGPMGMTTAASISRQVPRSSGRAVSGHFSDGKELAGALAYVPGACRGRALVDANRPPKLLVQLADTGRA
jgi:CubicO group peptidase (beta-lactamase class C family)